MDEGRPGQDVSVHPLPPMPDTRFAPEVPRHGVIRRERLLVPFQPALAKRLTLVCAPPGSGKTVLLSQVADDLGGSGSAARLSLGPAHAEAGAFASLLSDAISCGPARTTAAKSGPVFRMPEQAHTAERIAGDLITWAGRVVATHVLVIIDDFHLVEQSEGVRAVMSALLEHSPRTWHFVVSSRALPSLDLSRLRLLGDVIELSGQDLAFTDDEVGQVASALGVPLAPGMRAELVEATEGWAAGVALTCYALKTCRAGSGDTARLGSPCLQDAWDYMSAQSLDALDAGTRSFLAATSIFDTVEPALCDALLGVRDSERILEGLVSAGLFTYRLAGNPPVYRYHRLLRDFLRERLRRSGERDGYLGRAAELCRARGSCAQAVDYFLELGRHDDAARCILEVARPMLESGRHGLLDAWLAKIPPAALRAFPRLLVVQGNIREAEGNWDQAKAIYKEASALCRAGGDDEGLYQALWWSAGIAWRRGEYRQCVDLCTEALACLADCQKHERGGVHNLLAAAHFYLGLVDEGKQYLHLALRLQQEAGDRWGTGWVLNNLGYNLYMVQGDLDGALSAYEHALRCFEEIESLPGVAHVKGNMAFACLLKGELDRALDLVTQAEGAAREAREARTLAALQILRAQLCLEKRDTDGARSLIGLAAPVVEELREPFLQGSLLSVRSRICRWAGEAAEGKALARAARDCVSMAAADPSALFIAVDLGAACLDAGDFDEARRVFAGVLGLCIRLQAHLVEAQALLLLAAVEFAASSRNWRVHLCRAIRRIASGGYWRILERVTQAHPALQAFAKGRIEQGLVEALRQGCPASLRAALFAPCQAEALGGEAGEPKPAPVGAGDQGGPDMHIRMLGQFQVVLRGEPVPNGQWRASRAKALLKYLASNLGRWVPRDEILEALWPEKQPQAALNNFNVTLHALRRLLEPTLERGADSGFIRTRNSCYRLSPRRGCVVDVEEFEGACEHAQALASSGNAAESISAYQAAVEEYRGDLLPEDLYAPWTVARRESLRESFIRALLRLGTLLLERESPAETAARARQAIDADPWREDAHRLLMTALARAGQRAKALQHYRSMKEAFSGEFGVAPDNETTRLFERISRGELV